jgi:hypothetical protein
MKKWAEAISIATEELKEIRVLEKLKKKTYWY